MQRAKIGGRPVFISLRVLLRAAEGGGGFDATELRRVCGADAAPMVRVTKKDGGRVARLIFGAVRGGGLSILCAVLHFG
jgi:hypothetical protein